jgi:formate hydrogenlyase subunit 6/NADH:ubiquinone oxidoreductase subunit I
MEGRAMAATPEGKDARREDRDLVPIFVMGRRFEVPASLTIQKALEHAGYQLIRGCGCRGGICGACTTVYRKPGSYRVEVGLACQTVVEPDMYLTQVPFFPGNRATYALEDLEPDGATVARLYPEIFKCVGCNTCTRSCPMDIDVMDYMARAMRGGVARVAQDSLSCVMCGICAARCPAEEVQYNIAILCRRLYGRYIALPAEHLQRQVDDIADGKFEAGLRELMSMDADALRELYRNREMEPEGAPDDWTPVALP